MEEAKYDMPYIVKVLDPKLDIKNMCIKYQNTLVIDLKFK